MGAGEFGAEGVCLEVMDECRDNVVDISPMLSLDDPVSLINPLLVLSTVHPLYAGDGVVVIVFIVLAIDNVAGLVAPRLIPPLAPAGAEEGGGKPKPKGAYEADETGVLGAD